MSKHQEPQSGNPQKQSSVAHRILFYIILFSSFVTIIITCYQLYTDYKEQAGMVEQRMTQIERSYRDSLGNAIWFLNTKQIESILAGIMKFEDVHFVDVHIKDGDTHYLGVRRESGNLRHFSVDVLHTVQDNAVTVGKLSIESNLDGVLERLKKKFWLILISQGLKTFFVSLFILFIIHYLVTRHLRSIANFAAALDISEKEEFLSLERPLRNSSDELDQISQAVNQMKRELIEDTDAREVAALKLKKLSQAVEQSTASVIILNAKGEIEYVNPKFENATGMNAEEVLGKKSDNICFGKKKLHEYKDLWRSISSGKEWRGELQTQKKDGSHFWEAASVSSIKDTEHNITHYLILKDDISELRKLKEQLELERDYLREEVNAAGNFGEIIGASDALKATIAKVEAVAQTPASVLILGESGVGKEMIARAIHTKSLRADKPMVKVNCASIPNELFESEFFGHVKGSFTGAHQERIGRLQLADGGTLFLDEVGEIPIAQQGKLLRALQEGEFERIGDNKTLKVNVRVVAATNRDMGEEIKAGRFREDLYYRLNVFPVQVPPLRERIDDVIPLALSFLQSACTDLNREPFQLTQSQLQVLQQHSWPGNIRELKNTIERAVISSTGNKLRLDISSIDRPSTEAKTPEPLSISPNSYLTFDELKHLEKQNMIAALKHAGWKTWGEGGAAELLGIKPSTLAYQMKVFGIKKP